MKTLNKIFLILTGALLIFASCEEQIMDREQSPVMPENCLGVYFPSTNQAVVEMEPTEATEISIIISRTDSVSAVDVPITVEINDSNVYVVPEKVSFDAGEATTTFKVTFPNSEEGVTYNLKLKVVGDEYVNQYSSKLPYLLTNVTRIKWESLADPFIYVDGAFGGLWGISALAAYVSVEKAEVGATVRYRMKNVYSSMSTGEPDANGIYDGYPFNESGDFDEDNDYYTVIEVDKDGYVTMFPHEVGVDWGYGMFSVGSVYGFVSQNIDDYPLGELADDVITFGPNSLFMSMAGYEAGAKYPSAMPTIIYLTKDAYIAANMKIDDFNDVEYEEIEGAVSEFESAAYSDSWAQTLSAAIDIDIENEKSEYKNLFYFADLYADGVGVAFYYNGSTVSIPTNQKIGKKAFGKDVYVSGSDNIDSSVEVNAKGITIYTLGLKFHFKDGTSLGEFAEKFYYSKDPVAYTIADFQGKFTLKGKSLFGDPDAKMNVEITEGDVENELLIKGVSFAGGLKATYNPATSIMSIAPQTLDDYDYNGTMLDMTLLTYSDDDVSETAILDFTVNMQGQLVLTSTSEAIGYLIYSDTVKDFVDGYYELVFEPKPAAPATVKQSVKTTSITKQPTAKKSKISYVAPVKGLKNNFVIQPKSKRTIKSKVGNAIK